MAINGSNTAINNHHLEQSGSITSPLGHLIDLKPGVYVRRSSHKKCQPVTHCKCIPNYGTSVQAARHLDLRSPVLPFQPEGCETVNERSRDPSGTHRCGFLHLEGTPTASCFSRGHRPASASLDHIGPPLGSGGGGHQSYRRHGVKISGPRLAAGRRRECCARGSHAVIGLLSRSRQGRLRRKCRMRSRRRPGPWPG